jgi:capsular polysaccharide transport system permease protein
MADEVTAKPPAAKTAVAQPVNPTPIRATVISRSLKQVAQKVRRPDSLWAPYGAERRWQRTFLPAVIIGFVTIVIVPALLSGLYFLFIASDQYSSEARFAVRGGEFAVMEQLSGFSKIPLAERYVQDSLILYDYIQGRGIVEEIDKAIDLRSIYSRKGADFLARLDPTVPAEQLVRYWQSHVDVTIDQMSGVITVVARAFTPADALAITKAIIASSEKLVNDLSERSRLDTLRQAETELKIAEKYLQGKVRDFRDLRNQEGLVDAAKSAELMTKMVSDLRLELIRMEQEYAVQRRSVSPSAPQLRVLENRIVSMREQLKKLNDQITTTGKGKNDHVLSGSMSRFDRERLEKTLAEQQYVTAAGYLEKARALATTQQVYLATFQRPVLAEYALYPHSLWIWSVIAVVSLLLWGGGVGMAVLIRNHVAI